MGLQKSFTVEEALLKLQNYCAYQERCHKEVQQKLKEMRMIPEVCDTITLSLLEHGFLNEERFARTFVEGKFRIKKWGKHRLTSELKRKDISKFNINSALEQISEEEYLDVFTVLANKKSSTIQGGTKWQKRKKLSDYLIYRGWETYLVYAKANELFV